MLISLLRTIFRRRSAGPAREENPPRTLPGQAGLYPQRRPGSADSLDVESQLGLGKAHIAAGSLDAAQACMEAALAAHSADPRVLCCLGEIKGMQGEFDQALAWFGKALEASPQFGPALADMGLAMHKLRRLPEAETWLREAIRADPWNLNAWLTLGVVCRQLGRSEDAIHHHEQALIRFPDNPRILSGLGACHAHLGNLAVAQKCFDWALEVAPDFFEARLNRSFIYLTNGDYRLGFAEYESRLQKPELVRLMSGKPMPVWQGEPLATKKIALVSEQGYGDSIQFIRFAADLADRGATVHVETNPVLRRLLASAKGVSSCAETSATGFSADFFCPLMSLPHRLGITLETLPARTPYFRLRDGDVERWRNKLGSFRKLRVGIAWASDPDNWTSNVKSIALDQLLPVLAAQEVSYFSLQVGPGSEQARKWHGTIDITDLSADLKDFHDSACLVESLDLVISIDSAVAHLAGALLKPVWVLLRHAPDWRWGIEERGCAWYPSARLFRQTTAGNWEDVVADLALALTQFASSRS